MQGHKTLITVINHTTIWGIQMLTDGRIEQFWMPRYWVITNISWNMLFNSNPKALGSAPYYMWHYSDIEIYKLNWFVER